MPEEGAEFARDVTLRIERVIHGNAEPGAIFLVRAHESLLFSPAGERENSCSTLIPGRRALVALIGDGETFEDSALLTADSALLLDSNDSIIATGRIGATTALEAMTLDQVISLYETALLEPSESEAEPDPPVEVTTPPSAASPTAMPS